MSVFFSSFFNSCLYFFLVCQYCSLLNALFGLFHFDASASWSSLLPCRHCDTMFKGYIFLQFYVDLFQMQHSYRGKTSQQCEVGNASCIREGSTKLACHPPYRQTWICPPQRCIPRCPFSYDMAGNLPIYHLTASVANTSQLSMHQSALMVDWSTHAIHGVR